MLTTSLQQKGKASLHHFLIEFQPRSGIEKPMTNIPSVAQLRLALKLAEKIEEMQKELALLMGSQSPDAGIEAEPKKKRGRPPMTPEAREKIATAQRQRWAKSKGANS